MKSKNLLLHFDSEGKEISKWAYGVCVGETRAHIPMTSKGFHFKRLVLVPMAVPDMKYLMRLSLMSCREQ